MKSSTIQIAFAGLILSIFSMGALLSCSDGDGATPAEEREFPTGFLNVGHGGAKELCPANTLECFQHALDEGANALEVDLQVLEDGTLVTFHDQNTFDQTGEDHDLEDLTIEGLKGLDARWGFTPDGGETHPYRDQGIEVPTFGEFLYAFGRIPVLLDVKVETPAMADALESFARDEFDDDAREFVYIKTHDQRLTNTLRAFDPPLNVAFNTVERVALALLPCLFEEYPPTWLDLNPEFLFPHIITWSEVQDHILTTSTIDEVDEMREYLSIEELDGIVTDRPDLLDALLNP